MRPLDLLAALTMVAIQGAALRAGPCGEGSRNPLLFDRHRLLA